MSSHSVDVDMSDGESSSGASQGSALEFTIYTFPTAAPPPSHWQQQQQRFRKNKKNTTPTPSSSVPLPSLSGSPSSSSSGVGAAVLAVSDPSPLAPSSKTSASTPAADTTAQTAINASDNEMNLSSSRTDPSDSKVRSRMSDQSYVCDACGRSYHHRESYQRHMETHHKEKNSKGYNKQQAGQKQKHSRQTRSDASLHNAVSSRVLDDSSSASPPPPFRCTHCGENGNAAFDSLGELWRHQASYHPDVVRTPSSSTPYSFRSTGQPQATPLSSRAQRHANRKKNDDQEDEEENEQASTQEESSATPLTTHQKSSPPSIADASASKNLGERAPRHLRGGGNSSSNQTSALKTATIELNGVASDSTPLTRTNRQRSRPHESEQPNPSTDQNEPDNMSASSSSSSEDEGTNRRSQSIPRRVRTRERSQSRISPSNIRHSSLESLTCDRCLRSFARPAAMERHLAVCNAAAEAATAAAVSKKTNPSNDSEAEDESGVDADSDMADEEDGSLDEDNNNGELKRPRTSNAPLVPWNGTNCDGSARPGLFANCPFCGLGLNSRTRFYVHKRTCPDRPRATALTNQTTNKTNVRDNATESKSHGASSNAGPTRPSNSSRPSTTESSSNCRRRSKQSESEDDDEDPTDPQSASEGDSGNASNYRHSCSICQERFTAMSSLFRHADVHPQVGYRGSVFICRFCHSPFKFQQRATKHVPHCRRLPPNLSLSLPEEIIQHVTVIEATGKEDFYSQLRLDQDKKKRKAGSLSGGHKQRRGRTAIADDDSEDDEEDHRKSANRHDRKRTKLHHSSSAAAAASSSSRFKPQPRSPGVPSSDFKHRISNTSAAAFASASATLSARSCRTCKREWLNGISDYNYNLHVASCDRSARQLQALMGDAAKAEKQKLAPATSKNSSRSGNHDSTYSLDASDLLNTNTSRLNRSSLPNEDDAGYDHDSGKRGRRRSWRSGRGAKSAASGSSDDEAADDEGEYDESVAASDGNAMPQGPKVYFTCPVCQLNFDRESSLAAHVKAYSADEVNRFPCPVCPHRFPSRVMMHRHRQRHYSDISNIRLAPGETLMKAEDKGKGKVAKPKPKSPPKPKAAPQPKSHSHFQPKPTARTPSPQNPNKRRRAAAKRYAEETYEDDEDYDPPSEDEMDDEYEDDGGQANDADQADSHMHGETGEAEADDASESESAHGHTLELMSSLTSAAAAAAASSGNSASKPAPTSSSAVGSSAAPVGRVQLFIPSNAPHNRTDTSSKHKNQQPQRNTHSSASSAVEDDKRRSEARSHAQSHRSHTSERKQQPKPTLASVHPLNTDPMAIAAAAAVPPAVDMHHFMQLQAAMPPMAGFLPLQAAPPVNETVMLAPYSAFPGFPGMPSNPAAPPQPPPGFVYPPPPMPIHPMHFQHPAAPAFFAPPQSLQQIALPNLPLPGFSQSPPAMSPLTAMYAAAAATNPAAAAAAAASTFGYDFVAQNPNMALMMPNLPPFPFPKQ